MELVVETCKVHDRGCIGNQRMKTDVMISVAGEDKYIHDLFLTTKQAEDLYLDLMKILKRNEDDLSNTCIL